MNIKSYLYDNHNTPIGVRINDNGDEYTLPLEGLFSTIVFEELMASGYKLVNQGNYEFELDGVSTLTLPKEENYRLSPEEEMAFADYELTHDIMTISERVSRQSQKTNLVAFEGPINGEYTIKTRSEFLQYLNKNKGFYDDNDILPINAFVAPEARYSLQELATTFDDIANLLAERRCLSRPRFNNYVKWVEKRIGRTPTAKDLIEEYMKFGIDGVNVNIVSQNIVQNDNKNIFVASYAEKDDAAGLARGNYHELFYALVGSSANAGLDNYVRYEDNIPEAYRAHPLFYRPTDASSLFAKEHKNLDYNEYMPEVMIKPVVGTLYSWVAHDGSEILFDVEHIKFIIRDGIEGSGTPAKKIVTRMLSVADSSDFFKAIPLADWFISEEEFKTRTILKSLAKNLIDKRRVVSNESLFTILLDFGFTPGAAVRYIAAQAGCMDVLRSFDYDAGGSKTTEDDSSSYYISEPDINEYFRSGCDSTVLKDFHTTTMVDGMIKDVLYASAEAKIETIEDAISGSVAGDDIVTARVNEENYSVTKIYSYLYTAHKIMGIPIPVISAAIDNIGKDDTSFILTADDGSYMKVPAPKLTMVADAVNATRMNVKRTIAEYAPIFYIVDDVATEFTNDPEKTKRAVGVSGYRGCMYSYRQGGGSNNSSVLVSLSPLGKLVETLTEEYKQYQYDNHPEGLTIAQREEIALKAGQVAKLYLCRAVEFDGRIVDKGLPPKWYDIKEDFTRWSIVKAGITRFYASTAFICETMFTRCVPNGTLGKDYEEYAPTYNCLNAVVTPTAVYPTGTAIMHETPLRAVFNAAHISSNPKAYRPYLASYISDDGSGAWDSATSDNASINPIMYRRRVDENFTAKGAVTSYNMLTAESRNYWYRGIVKNCGGLEDKENSYNAIVNCDIALKQAADTDLFKYYADAMACLKEDIATGTRCIAPKHPIEYLYPTYYGDPKLNEMIKDNPTPLQRFKGTPAVCLAGPKFTEDSVNGLAVKHPVPVDKVALPTSQAIATTTMVNGYTLEEILECDDLLNRSISATKKLIAYNNGHFYIQDGETSKEITAEEVANLNPDVYAVRRVTGRITHFLDHNRRLRRITI